MGKEQNTELDEEKRTAFRAKKLTTIPKRTTSSSMMTTGISLFPT